MRNATMSGYGHVASGISEVTTIVDDLVHALTSGARQRLVTA